MSFLSNPQDLCRVSSVNKIWLNWMVTHDSKWKTYLPHNTSPKCKNYKELFNDKGIVSINQLIDRVGAFSLTIPSNRNAEFNCLFPENMNSYFSVRIINNFKNQKSVIKENCWFVKTKFVYKQPTKFRMVFTDDNKFFVSIRVPDELTYKDTSDKIIDRLEQNIIPTRAEASKRSKMNSIVHGIFNWIPGFKKSDDN
jgi:hypothetical protein